MKSSCGERDAGAIDISAPILDYTSDPDTRANGRLQCHAKAFEAWKGSHHDLAMQPADERTVLGNFGDARFTYAGTTSTFFKRDRRIMVRTDGPGARGERTRAVEE